MKFSYVYLLGLLAVASCTKSGGTEANEANSVKVKVAEVKEVMTSTDFRYSGTVEPEQSIPLTFQSMGIVTQVLVQEGDAVKKGQLLASVEKSDNESMYNSAVAKYRQAKDAYDRMKSVYEKGSLPEIKWVEMETNLKQAESQVELYRSNLNKSYLKAPASGVIGKRDIEPGQHTSSSLAPLEIVKIDRILVKVAVPENEIGKLHKGMKATFSISALNDRQFNGTITHIGVVADQISRTYEVKIQAENPGYLMKPGMVCDVLVHPNELVKATVAPYEAVSKDSDGKPFVMVVNPSSKVATKKSVKVGQYSQDGIVITDGIDANTLVITEGKEKVANNTTISY
jgi:RND family efflux transporter MFP subunit